MNADAIDCHKLALVVENHARRVIFTNAQHSDDATTVIAIEIAGCYLTIPARRDDWGLVNIE